MDNPAQPATVLANPATDSNPILKPNDPTTPVVATPLPETTTPEQKPSDQKFSSKFAALTRKEKVIREEQSKLKVERESLKAKLAELEAFEKDPYNFLESKDPKAYEKWAHRKMKGSNAPTVEEQIQSIKEKLTEKEKAEEAAKLEAQKAEDDRTVKSVKTQIKEFIQANEKYEILQNEDADYVRDLVFEVIEGYFAKTKTEDGQGRILSYEEACDMAENYLTHEYKRRMNLKKLQPKEAQTPPESDGKPTSDSLSQSKTPSPSANTGTKTLTNQLTAEIPNRAERKLSVDESKERLKSFIKFT